MLQGTSLGGRRKGRQRKRWDNNIKEWIGLIFSRAQRVVEDIQEERKVVKTSVVPQGPND